MVAKSNRMLGFLKRNCSGDINKDRLLNLNLLPINYWLEYLDLLFFYKCIYGIIEINLDNFAQFCSGRSRRGSSGLFLNNKTSKTSLFRDSFFIRIINLWNALPIAIRSEVQLVPFKKKLKSFFYNRLSSVFNHDDIRSYKLVCPKYRRVNTATRCSC